MLCAVGVMWARSPVLYTFGVICLFISMSFDLVDGWFAARFQPHPALAPLADRILDKVVYSIIFPLVTVGEMWRLVFISEGHTRPEMLHAIFCLFLCVSVLIRDNFAHFMRGFALRQGQEPEERDFTRIRTAVAAPVGALLYAHAFYVPEGPPSQIYFWISWLGNLPLRLLFLIEIVFLVINFGSIAGLCRKYGSYCLDELCEEDRGLRRRILTFFPNSLTVMNAVMGLLSVFFAYQYRIREAYLILIGATLFDKLDGAVARKLGLTETPVELENRRRISLGALLDDVADAVSFCIVPAWIFYVYLQPTENTLLRNIPLGIIVSVYALFGLIRLVYFTLDQSPIPGFFKGLPVPAAALLVMAPLVIFDQAVAETSGQAYFWGFFCPVAMLTASVLMNLYPIRYIHYGRFMNRHPVFSMIMLAMAFVFVFTPYFGHYCFACMIGYVLSPLFTWRISPEVAAREP
jgi:phosphatidylserine synthase